VSPQVSPYTTRLRERWERLEHEHAPTIHREPHPDQGGRESAGSRYWLTCSCEAELGAVVVADDSEQRHLREDYLSVWMHLAVLRHRADVLLAEPGWMQAAQSEGPAQPINAKAAGERS
jgi:hypothetical protein